MSNLNDVKQRMMNHIATLYSAEKSIPDLVSRAEALTEQAERRRAIQDRIDKLDNEINPLAAELVALKQPYIDALWDQDGPEQRRIQKEKKRLEGEITAIQKAVADERAKLASDSVDAAELVALRATLDAFDLPNAWGFTRSLTTPLQAVERDLNSRVADIARSLQGLSYDQEEYERYRRETDQDYRRRQEALEADSRATSARIEASDWGRIERRNRREEAIAAGPVDGRVSTRDLKPWEEDED